LAFHVSGKFFSLVMPSPVAPRNCGQLSARVWSTMRKTNDVIGRIRDMLLLNAVLRYLAGSLASRVRLHCIPHGAAFAK
jgi:hypothetical protein